MLRIRRPQPAALAHRRAICSGRHFALIAAAVFRLAFQRTATPQEIEAALKFVADAETPPKFEPSETAKSWSYGWGKFDPTAGKTVSFQPIPHYTGAAWQGGAAWPDSVIGWVQLTATGGHPGNDLDHAAIRRWTAPKAMRISIRSEAKHEPMPGDGFRASISSSRTGPLASLILHQRSADLSVAELQVEAGETLDFVADIGGSLGHDQFLWTIELKELPAAGATPAQRTAVTTWNSKADFVGPPTIRLEPWEQLAQILLVSNEFLFID